MNIGKYGVWFSTNALDKAQLVALAQGVERLNYDVLWYPESLGTNPWRSAGSCWARPIGCVSAAESRIFTAAMRSRRWQGTTR